MSRAAFKPLLMLVVVLHLVLAAMALCLTPGAPDTPTRSPDGRIARTPSSVEPPDPQGRY